MVNWSDPAEIQADYVAFTKNCHVFAGIYFWEYCTTLDFEWSFITRKRRFRWPMIFYFLARYMLLITIIGQLVAIDVTTEVNCNTLYTFNAAAALASVGLASINLAVRTMVLWGYQRIIVIPLIIGICGYWSLVIFGSPVSAHWVEGQGCVVETVRPNGVVAAFIYSMSFDFVVLALAAGKMLFGIDKRTALMNLMFKDGLIYFLIVAVANIPATTMTIINLNPIMRTVLVLPLVVASTIVSCRAVRRLSSYNPNKVEVFMSQSKPPTSLNATYNVTRPDGVHVQMETFAVADASQDKFSPISPIDKYSSSDVDLEEQKSDPSHAL
ncbi:hypothetical protein C8Q75DRAFT_731660 [Abortiporus biennis]|nr:hypothetical protein C8Q75DRAFT_731660 [Abortiporus biennis]